MPRAAGAFSAVGIAASDLVVERDRTLLVPLEEASIGPVVSALEREAARELEGAGVDPAGAAVEVEADLRYRGQSHELTVPFAVDEPPGPGDFHRAHRSSYGHDSPGEVVELVNLRVRLRLPGPQLEVTELEPTAGAHPAEHRGVLFEAGWLTSPAYARGDLGRGDGGHGPAVIEGEGETCLVPPGLAWSVDGRGDLWLEPDGGGGG